MSRPGGPPEPATLYRIASITKTFTGSAVMQLRDAGRLALDEPAVTYLPELRRAANPFGPIEAVTIRRMLCHESGLAVDPPGTDWSVSRYQGSPRNRPWRTRPVSRSRCARIAAQVLRPCLPAARRDRHQGQRHPLPAVRPRVDPRAARDVGDRLRAADRSRCGSGARSVMTGRAWPASSARAGDAAGVGRGRAVVVREDLARWIAFQLSAHAEPSATVARSWRRNRCARCTGRGTWPTRAGLGRGASPGAASGARTTSGSSTPEGCRDSRRTCASTPHAGLERSCC